MPHEQPCQTPETFRSLINFINGTVEENCNCKRHSLRYKLSCCDKETHSNNEDVKYIYIDRLHINEIKFVRSETDAEIIMAGLILTLMKFTNVSYDGV